MDLRLDPASSVPLYAQVVEQIRALVASRAYRTGDRLPSVRELAGELRLNRNTVAKSYQVLEAEGVVETRPGQGCFVAGETPRWSRRERRRRLDAALDRAVLEARQLDLPLDELPDLLAERVRAFRTRTHTRSRTGT